MTSATMTTSFDNFDGLSDKAPYPFKDSQNNGRLTPQNSIHDQSPLEIGQICKVFEYKIYIKEKHLIIDKII